MSSRKPLLALIAGIALLATLITPASDQPATAAIPEDFLVTKTVVDDADLAKWTYTGSWGHAKGEAWTKDEVDDTESFSNTMGARATLQFSGTGIIVSGPFGPNGGLFRVTLDCGQVVEGSAYAPEKRLHQTLATFDDLVPGMHTVVIETLGVRGTGSWDSFVMLDAATVLDDALAHDSPPHDGGTGALTLRRPGCGTASNLVDAHRARHGGSDFSMALQGTEVTSVDLPDLPRTMRVLVAAEDGPVQFAVADADGTFLPMTVLTGTAGTMTATTTNEAIPLQEGASAEVLVDLRGRDGTGSHGHVQLWAFSWSGTLDILTGHVTDVAAPRLARQLNAGVPLLPELPGRIAAPAEAFRHGPVVLSRVLADADQPARTTSGEPVTVVFGPVRPGEPAMIDGVAQPADTIGIQIPESGQSVHLVLDTTRRCRTLTASVGLDDRSPAGAWAELAVYADGQLAQASHNGLWQWTGVGASPTVNGAAREAIANQLRDAKLATVATAFASDASARAAYEAIVAAEHEALISSIRDRSAATMRYLVPTPVRVGEGTTLNRGAPARFTPPNAEAGAERGPVGWVAKSVPSTPVDAQRAFPISIDLIAPQTMDRVRYAASHGIAGAEGLGHVLAGTVELVVNGSPGAVLDLVGAGLDCVSVDPAPDGTPAPVYAMPTFSQIGVAPLFLPAPRDAKGNALTELVTSPLWWDLACPNGPSTKGPTFTATRERYSNFGVLGWNGRDYGIVEVHETATATKPACGLPADQARDDYGPYQLASGSPGFPTGTYDNLGQTVRDTIRDRLISIDGTWKEKIVSWASNAWFEAGHDEIGLALWLAMAPFDLPAALVFNPFVMHALPAEAQLVLGAAFLRMPSVSVFGAAIPAASGLAAGVRGTLESTNEVLLLTEAQMQAAKAAGAGLVLEVGEGMHLLIPVRPGTKIADLLPRLTSTPLVVTDRAVSRMPVLADHAPWVADSIALGEAEITRLCGRDVEMKFCSLRLPEWLNMSHWTGQFGSLRYPRGFGERYPNVTTSTALSNTPEAAQAIEATRRLNGGVIDPALVFMGVNGAKYPVAFVTDALPLYRFASRGPDVIFAEGFQVREGALEAFKKGDSTYLDIIEHADPAKHARDDALYVSTTRDPDLLGARYQFNGQLASHWRYKVSGGGGVEVKASFGQGNQAGLPAVPDNVRAAANDGLILGESEVAIPGGIDPKFIERADYMQYNPATRRFEVMHSVPNPGFRADLVYGPGTAVPAMTETERVGASVADSPFHHWARFDWLPPARAPFALSIPVPSGDIAAQAGQGLFVFTKSEQAWRVYGPGTGVTPDILTNAGFVPGTYADYPTMTFWIPRVSGIPITAVNAPGFAKLATKRSVDEGPSPSVVTLAWNGLFLSESGQDYAVTGPGHGVHDLAVATTPDGWRWKLEELNDGSYRLINPAFGTAVQITNEWHDPARGQLNVVATPTSWNNHYQRWTLESGDDGAIILHSVTSPDLTLQITNDWKIIAGPPNYENGQWRLEAAR